MTSCSDQLRENNTYVNDQHLDIFVRSRPETFFSFSTALTISLENVYKYHKTELLRNVSYRILSLCKLNLVQGHYATRKCSHTLYFNGFGILLSTFFRRSRLFPITLGPGNSRTITLEKKGHVLQTVAPSLRVEKVRSESITDEDSNEHEVVLPPDGRQRNGVDEGVEDQCSDSR